MEHLPLGPARTLFNRQMTRENEEMARERSPSAESQATWDVFISYAHEDKDELVQPLARRLEEHGLNVWLDDSRLRVGDYLRQSDIKKHLENGSKLKEVIIVPLHMRDYTPLKAKIESLG